MSYNYPIIVSICILSFIIPNADGDIRDEIIILKEKLSMIQEDIIQSSLDIIEQKKIIKDNENRLAELKIIEKEKRANINKSWTGQQEYEQAQKDVRNAQNILDKSNQKLQLLYDTRNGYFVETKSLEEQLTELEKKPLPKPSVNGIIGITVDNNCKAFIKHNMTTDCPTPELLDTLYPGSPCDYSEEGCVKYYSQIGGFHYIIDPPAAVMERIRMVEIRSNFEEFHMQGSAGYDDTQHTVNYQTGRYLDGCKTAYIGTNDWIRFLGDSIYLLYKNCDESYSNLGGYRYEQLNQTTHDITSSYKYQLDQWIKQSKQKCREKCFEY